MIDLFSWIISLRSETLSPIVKIFPFFASDSFYILFLAIGIWRQPRKRLFWDLGFLVPFSTLLNSILKNLFSIARPDTMFHMVPVHDPFGFPSGDVQVAVVFWGMICLARRSLWLFLMAICLILLMAFSRIYLGVHSPNDVAAGFLFGVLTLWIYRGHFCQLFVSQWFLGKTRSFWGVNFVGILAYIFLSLKTPIPPMVVMAIGALIGYGLSLQWIFSQRFDVKNEQANLWLICLSLGLLSATVYIFPVANGRSTILFWGTGLLKYAMVVMLIYVFLPEFQRWVCTPFMGKKSAK